jgi:hypothetical protein
VLESGRLRKKRDDKPGYSRAHTHLRPTRAPPPPPVSPHPPSSPPPPRCLDSVVRALRSADSDTTCVRSHAILAVPTPPTCGGLSCRSIDVVAKSVKGVGPLVSHPGQQRSGPHATLCPVRAQRSVRATHCHATLCVHLHREQRNRWQPPPPCTWLLRQPSPSHVTTIDTIQKRHRQAQTSLTPLRPRRHRSIQPSTMLVESGSGKSGRAFDFVMDSPDEGGDFVLINNSGSVIAARKGPPRRLSSRAVSCFNRLPNFSFFVHRTTYRSTHATHARRSACRVQVPRLAGQRVCVCVCVCACDCHVASAVVSISL